MLLELLGDYGLVLPGAYGAVTVMDHIISVITGPQTMSSGYMSESEQYWV